MNQRANDTYSSSWGRSLKTDDTDNSGVLWYYAMSGYFSEFLVFWFIVEIFSIIKLNSLTAT